MKQLTLLVAFLALVFSQTVPQPTRNTQPTDFTTPSVGCTAQQVATCQNTVYPTLPLCGDSFPVFDKVKCCYSCRTGPVNTCRVDPSTIPECPAQEQPTVLSNGCNSCRARNGRVYPAGNCTKSDFDACVAAISSLPDCADGEVPTRTGCCISCKPLVSDPPCTSAQWKACEANYSSLRVCDATEQPVFDPTTCCRTCRRNPPSDETPVNGVCNKARFEACVRNSTVCRDGELPVTDASKCCASCKRPELLCTREDVVSCLASTRACDVDERPTYVSGECCPTCIPPKPVCNHTCDSTEKCVRREGGNACVPKRVLRFHGDHLPANYSAEDIKNLISEIVKRFCDRSDNEAMCKNFKLNLEHLLEGINCARNRTEVDVEVPTTSSKRQTEFGAVVAAAVSDPIAAGQYTLAQADTTSTTSETSGSVTLVASFLALFISFLL